MFGGGVFDMFVATVAKISFSRTVYDFVFKRVPKSVKNQNQCVDDVELKINVGLARAMLITITPLIWYTLFL